MGEPNDLLRQARLRLPSPSGSGRSMSRQELADAANDYLFGTTKRVFDMDANHVGKLERGEHRWPGAHYRDALRAVLKVDTDANLGFYVVRVSSSADRLGSHAVAASQSADIRRHRAVGTRRPDQDELGQDRVPADGQDTGLAAVLEGLRSALTAYRPAAGMVGGGRPLSDVATAAGELHEAYQRADYGAAARMLPVVLEDAEKAVVESSGSLQPRALRTQAVAYIAASKLAAKAGASELAWLAADRAATVARLANARTLSALAAYQVACAFLHPPTRLSEAEAIAVTAAEDLTGSAVGMTPDLLSARGSLLLLAAVTAARRQDPRAARRYLAEAATAAEQLGRDDNHLWTAFGPTNVIIHEVSVAVALAEVDRANEIGDVLDTSRLPLPLLGRRSQVHLDLASACARRPAGDSVAVLHLLEAERIAPQAVRVNAAARNLLAELLGRERRTVTPGLRPLAQRAGVAV